MVKVLLVDDDEDILSVLRILFKHEGYALETRSSGINLLSITKEMMPNLIILDVKLSEYDGRILCTQLKSDEATQHIPIILFSSMANDEVAFNEYNADDFIAKPFDVQEMIKIVQHHVLINSASETLV